MRPPFVTGQVLLCCGLTLWLLGRAPEEALRATWWQPQSDPCTVGACVGPGGKWERTLRAKIRLPPVPRPLRLSKIKTTVTSGPEAAGQLPGRTCSWKRLWAGHELGSAETQRVTGASGADFPCRRIGGFCYSVDSIKVFLYKSQVAAGPAAAGLGPQTPGSVQEKL